MSREGKIRAFLLAAGIGSRLRPLTDNWPKCMMPINSRPLLSYWIDILSKNGVESVLLNTHFKSEVVDSFVKELNLERWLYTVHEKQLFGTAGSIRKNLSFFHNKTALIIHADNLCQCDFSDFLDFHFYRRDRSCPITMMLFETETPESSGIVELDNRGIIVGFHEKSKSSKGNLANAAVYIIEPEVMNWISSDDNIEDFSTQVIPNFLGRIAAWRNTGIHRDIGNEASLKMAQLNRFPISFSPFLESAVRSYCSSTEYKELIRKVAKI